MSHALGIVLSIAGLAVLAAFAALHGDVWRIVSVCVYGTTLILLYTASTLYHAVPNPRRPSRSCACSIIRRSIC